MPVSIVNHVPCTYCDRLVTSVDADYTVACPRCQQISVAIAATPDWLLIKLIGGDRLSRMIADRMKLEVERRYAVTR